MAPSPATPDAEGQPHDSRMLRNWPKPLRRIGGGTALGILVFVAASVALAGRSDAPESSLNWQRPDARLQPTVAKKAAHEVQHLREGVRLENTLGTFKSTGGRITFYPADTTPPLHALENLALERVWRLQDVSQGRQWSVSGVVTEFRGANYLLITKAILKNSNE